MGWLPSADWRDRQIGSVPIPCLVAGCHGRPNPCQCLDPRGNDGDGRGVLDRTHVTFALLDALGARLCRLVRCHHSPLGGNHRRLPNRPETLIGLFNCQPARLHVYGARPRFQQGPYGGSHRGGDVPFADPRILQSLVVPFGGNVMHAMGDVIDMKQFSGLRRVLPWTHNFVLDWCRRFDRPSTVFRLLEQGWNTRFVVESNERPDSWYKRERMAWMGLLTALLTSIYTMRAYFRPFRVSSYSPRKLVIIRMKRPLACYSL